MPRISVIIPTLNEAARIVETLQHLASIRNRDIEIILADGGSGDDTVTLARAFADKVIVSRPGRAAQMNAGVAAATGDVLLFLHADTSLPAGAIELVTAALIDRGWGRFDVRFSSRERLLSVVAFAMNLRSRLTGIATGDQAMFVRRDWFVRAGGFADMGLMEDIELSRALKRLGPPACLRATVTTSSRRWKRHGIIFTVLEMWLLRLLYWAGVDADRLARWYYRLPDT